MLDSLKQLREDADKCTRMAGVENEFETVWITKAALLKDIDAIEQEVEEDYIRLPMDANGEPITYDTMIEQWGALGSIWCRMEADGSFTWYVRGHDTSAPIMKASEVTVVKPPILEDLLEDALNKAANLDRKEGYWPSATDITNLLNEIAPKLQLREEH